MSAASATPPARTQEDALRFVLAINRGMQLLDRETETGRKLASDFAGVFSPSTSKSQNQIGEVYASIHETLFQDWQAQNHLHPQNYHPDVGATNRGKISTALRQLLNEGNHSLIQPNGTARTLTPQILAGALARFYHEVSRIKPFAYGNRITLELFLTALLDQKIFRNIEGYECKLDFRRLTEDEKRLLRDPNTSVDGLTDLFINAINPERTPPLAVNDENGFTAWPRREVMLHGTLFLAHEKDGEHYVVTVNGGLVKQEVAERLYKAHLEADSQDNPKLLADFYIPKENITDYLSDTESLRAKGKTHIDGFALRDDGAVPLVCLEQDILTGLRRDQKTFEGLFDTVCARKFPGEKSEIFRLANNQNLKDALLQEAGDNRRLSRAVEVAYDHVTAVVAAMDAAKKKIFQKKTPAESPVFYMSMGGASAGKGSVKDLIEAECEKNWVETSLDDFRHYSDLHGVLVAADHHADDYALVERMASSLRDWVKDYALAEKYNLLYDGSGIPYLNRYDKIVADAKEKGFRTHLCAVDAPMDQVADRVIKRFNGTQRTLPWTVTTGKHTDLPFALLPAIDHLKLDKISLFANDTEEHKKGRWLAAESFSLSETEVAELTSARDTGGLAEKFKALIDDAEKGATLPLLRKSKKETEEGMIKRYPDIREDNVSFFIHPQDKDRVFVIYDVARLTELVKKGQMNKQAGSQEGLTTLPETARFLVSNVSSNGLSR